MKKYKVNKLLFFMDNKTKLLPILLLLNLFTCLINKNY